ncbi:hypothetical protein [Streptomyces nitrosporeus]|uniref:hypothetical protein n=1 Tax=Streptomyces nitrosporeus TaxID=28894 RepID=UPI0039A0BCA4
MVDRYWRATGYRIKAVNNDADFPAIYAQTPEGYVVSLRFGGVGQALFRVDSPCVEVSEVADPTSRATAALDAGAEGIPRPRVRSPFWSAGAP